MSKVRLNWTDRGLAEEGVKVYRSSSQVDPDNLPSPLASLPVDREVYEDTTPTEGATNHYYVAPYIGSTTYEGEHVSVSSVECPPQHLCSTSIYAITGTTSITVKIPTCCKENDLIVASGFTRSTLTPPSGWTSGGSVPDGADGYSVDQKAFVYYKLAGADEGGDDVTFTQSASDRMGMQIHLFRHSTSSITVANLTAAKKANGLMSGAAMTATNGNYKSLVLFSWTFSYQTSVVTNHGNIAGIPSEFLVLGSHKTSFYAPEGIYQRGDLITQASENQALSLTITTYYSDSTSGRLSYIAIAIKV